MILLTDKSETSAAYKALSNVYAGKVGWLVGGLGAWQGGWLGQVGLGQLRGWVVVSLSACVTVCDDHG